MEPTNFNKERWHYCHIFTALTSDEAIKQGLIAKDKEQHIIFLFMEIWEEPMVQKWLCKSRTSEFNEKHLLQIIGFLHQKMQFCPRVTKSMIARFLLDDGCLDEVKSYNSIAAYLSRDLVPDLKKRIFGILYAETPKSMVF